MNPNVNITVYGNALVDYTHNNKNYIIMKIQVKVIQRYVAMAIVLSVKQDMHYCFLNL